MIGSILPSTVRTVQIAGRKFSSLALATFKSSLFVKHFVAPAAAVDSPCLYHTVPGTFRERLTTKMEGGELIPATQDDFRQVVNLNCNIYDGLDYLPSTFPHLVRGPGVQGFVYKVRGETVGFFSSLLLDEEQTVLFMAGRVKDTLQGQGLFTQIREAREKHFSNRQLYPRLRRQVCVTHHAKDVDGFRLVMRTFRADRAVEAASLSRATLKHLPRQISILKPQELKQLFQSDPTHLNHLFPQRRFILGERPYAVTPVNLPTILNSGWNTQFLGTNSDDGGYTLLSAGGYHLCQFGICYMVDIFGSGSGKTWDSSPMEIQPCSDFYEKNGMTGYARHAAVKDHVLTHLHRLQDLCHYFTGKAVFGVFASDMLEDAVNDVTRGIETFKIFQPDDGCILWERQM